MLISPRDDPTRVLEAWRPGDEIVLGPGEYAGGWRVTRGGSREAPLVVRSLDADRPARIRRGSGSSLVDVRASHVVLRALHFVATPAGVHGVVISGVDDVAVEGCRFDGIGGLAVVQTMTGRGLAVRGNRIRGSRSTAIYLGCHTGTCAVTDLVIEDNEIDGVTAPWRRVGYGIQVKLGSYGTIRGNVIRATKGPGIMVYGAARPGFTTVVARNTVIGSRRSSGIVVGGGPAVVQNNVVAHHADAGIALEDYDRRGLLIGVDVCDNTVHGNRRGGIVVRGRVVRATVAGNLITG